MKDPKNIVPKDIQTSDQAGNEALLEELNSLVENDPNSPYIVSRRISLALTIKQLISFGGNFPSSVVYYALAIISSVFILVNGSSEMFVWFFMGSALAAQLIDQIALPRKRSYISTSSSSNTIKVQDSPIQVSEESNPDDTQEPKQKYLSHKTISEMLLQRDYQLLRKTVYIYVSSLIILRLLLLTLNLDFPTLLFLPAIPIVFFYLRTEIIRYRIKNNLYGLNKYEAGEIVRFFYERKGNQSKKDRHQGSHISVGKRL